MLPASPPPQAAKEIISYSGVLRWPQKLFRLPFGVDVGGFYNVSENFVPLAGRLDGFGRPLDSPTGETEEYGLNLSLWQDKLSFRMSHFETAIVNQTFGDATKLYALATTGAVVQTASLWIADLNNFGINRQAQIDQLFSPLPANYKDLYQYRVTTDAQGRTSGAFVSLAGRADTADFTATGTEFEIIANPTRRWRLLVNVAKQKTVTTNVAPNTRAFMELMMPVWNQLRSEPRGSESFSHYLDTTIILPYETLKAQPGYFMVCTVAGSQSVLAAAISGLSSKPQSGFVLARKCHEKKTNTASRSSKAVKFAG